MRAGDRDGRQNFLVKALTASIKMTPAGVMTGQAGDVADQLRKLLLRMVFVIQTITTSLLLVP